MCWRRPLLVVHAAVGSFTLPGGLAGTPQLPVAGPSSGSHFLEGLELKQPAFFPHKSPQFIVVY